MYLQKHINYLHYFPFFPLFFIKFLSVDGQNMFAISEFQRETHVNIGCGWENVLDALKRLIDQSGQKEKISLT